MKSKLLQKKIETLRKEIRRHDYKYYVEGQPEIADPEYDRLYRELVELEKKYPSLVKDDSPTQRVGGEPIKEFMHLTHRVPMLSLENAYSPEELYDFEKRIRRILGEKPLVEYAVELKFDGVAINLEYEKGLFIRGSTRGDGVTGDDITLNLKTIRSLPLVLEGGKDIPFLEVRGEVYMDKKGFEKLNRGKKKSGEPLMANPRNAAAGSLKLLDPREVAKRPLNLFVHGLGYREGTIWDRHFDALKALKGMGFRISPLFELVRSMDEVIKISGEWEKKREGLDFEVDGLVVKVNSFPQHEKLGSTTKNPRWAIAYKFSAKQATTTLKDIQVQVGRTGALTPVAILEPVELSGSTISRATLHNEDEIRRKDIRIGDRVILEKGGEVIPKVVKAIEGVRTGREKVFTMPKKCPACAGNVIKEEGEVASRCENLRCPAQVEQRIKHFASRDAMNIDGLGESIIRQLVGRKMVRDYTDLYYLDKKSIAEIERMGEKSSRNLIEAIEASKDTTLGRFIFALGIRHVGIHAAEILASHFHTIDRLAGAALEKLEHIREIGPIMAQSISWFFKSKEGLAALDRFKKIGIKIASPEVRKQKFSGLTFVLTGTLDSLTRSEAKEMIRQAGGKISSSVSKKTDCVIVGRDPGSKLDRARKLGIKIIDENEFKMKMKMGTATIF